MRLIGILMQREIKDLMILFVLAGLLSCIGAGRLYLINQEGDASLDGSGATLGMVLMLAICAAALGGLQIEGDKDRGVSTFLCTQTVTRTQILIAKWLTGILWIGLTQLPYLLLLGVFSSGRFLMDNALLTRLWLGLCLVICATYTFGMHAGFYTHKMAIILCGLIVLPVLFILLIIKGFDAEGMGLLIAMISAFSVNTWWKFQTTAF